MTLTPNRIEAAARAIDPDAWHDVHPAQQRMMDLRKIKARGRAAQAVAAFYPELANGTAWLAPMEATEGMIAGSHWVHSADGRQCWAEMRDAFLQEPKEPE